GDSVPRSDRRHRHGRRLGASLRRPPARPRRPRARDRGAGGSARARPGRRARADRPRAGPGVGRHARHRPQPHGRHRADPDPGRARPEGRPCGVRRVSTTEFLYLSQEDVVAAGGTDMAAMVDVIERAFAVKADGEVRMPPKVMITWADEPGTE